MTLAQEFADELVRCGAPEQFAEDNAEALVAVLMSPPWFDEAVERMLCLAFKREGLTCGDGGGWHGFDIDEGRVDARRRWYNDLLRAAAVGGEGQ